MRADKELPVLSVVSMIGSIIVTIAFMLPIFLSRLYESFSGGSSSATTAGTA